MAIIYIHRICPGVLIFEGRIFCLAMLDLELPLSGVGVVVGGSGGGGCRQEAHIVYPLSKVWFPTCYVYPTWEYPVLAHKYILISRYSIYVIYQMYISIFYMCICIHLFSTCLNATNCLWSLCVFNFWMAKFCCDILSCKQHYWNGLRILVV